MKTWDDVGRSMFQHPYPCPTCDAAEYDRRKVVAIGNDSAATADAERRAAHDGLVAALTRDLLSARAKFDSVQEHVAYLLERYDITPKT